MKNQGRKRVICFFMALIMFICGLYSGNYTNNTVEKC